MSTLKQIGFLKQILTEQEYIEIKKDKKVYLKSLELYSKSYIDSVNVVSINNRRFIINKLDMAKLKKNWKNTLGKLTLNESLTNPVYVDVGPDGVIFVE